MMDYDHVELYRGHDARVEFVDYETRCDWLSVALQYKRIPATVKNSSLEA